MTPRGRKALDKGFMLLAKHIQFTRQDLTGVNGRERSDLATVITRAEELREMLDEMISTMRTARDLEATTSKALDKATGRGGAP